ncbi:MAG TPA: ATP-binding cassette domain-containing protein, partial [Polyangiaceae bacterium]
MRAVVAAGALVTARGFELKMRARGLTVRYGDKVAIADVSIEVRSNLVLALIGPSGCGKSTFLRALNRMNDTVPGASTSGQVELDGEPIYATDVDAVLVRRRVGMVFQRSNPFPKSIFEN